MTPGKSLVLALPVLALALAGCSKQPQPTYQAEQSDMVVENPTAPAVPVDLPTTPMTNAPADAAAATKAPAGKTR